MEKKIPQRASKKDRLNSILKAVEKWQKEGTKNEEIAEKLTPQQWDFLVDNDIEIDDLILSASQKKVINDIKKSPRPVGLVYNKKYPQEKQNLYNSIAEMLKNKGAKIDNREKQNYRDLDFTLDGIRYKIVLSTPRTKKNN